MINGDQRDASISPCGKYRWWLSRIWDERPMLLVVGMNPSIGDDRINDPTLTLTSHIAAHNGFGGFFMTNLNPLRCSKPQPAIDMFRHAQAQDPNADLEYRNILWDNLQVIQDKMDLCAAVLVAWGSMGETAGDWHGCVLQTIRERRPKKLVYTLGFCLNGHPRHPLGRGKHKVPKDAKLLEWREAA